MYIHETLNEFNDFNEFLTKKTENTTFVQIRILTITY